MPAGCDPVAPAAAGPPPPASITLGPRHGHTVPSGCGHSHTGAGNIDVAQPSPDTVVVTMTGVAAAGAQPVQGLGGHALNFDLCQDFEVSFDSPKLKKAKLVVEARVIGLLRSRCKGGGAAEEGPGCAMVDAGGVPLVTCGVPEHAVAGGENLSVNDHDGPFEVPIAPGKYALHQTFTVSATHPKTWCPGKAVAEFGSDSELDKPGSAPMIRSPGQQEGLRLPGHPQGRRGRRQRRPPPRRRRRPLPTPLSTSKPK